jgi:two-component system CheB/CheR fusion protein
MRFKLLDALAPPSVLVDADHNIVHLSPAAGRFLRFSGGEPSRNLLRAINSSLRVELRAALYEAGQSVDRAEVVVPSAKLDEESVEVTIRVSQARDVAADPVARHLDRGLERLQAHLRDTVEQYEASTEELKASNEELQAMNEELRSAPEERETSREELQSINEELTTVNVQLKSKVDELAHSRSGSANARTAAKSRWR